MTVLARTKVELDAFKKSVGKGLLAFVPTMGAIHQGHLALVKHAQEIGDKTIVSIYVNPKQFGPGEDFEAYPRSLKEDVVKLKTAKVDCIFAPSDEVVYPKGAENTWAVKADEGLAEILCGANRKGHFDGVCTVVKRLLDLIDPNFMIMGEKDYQQLLIVKNMVAVNGMGVEVINSPTIREPDGLAVSSRNQYLSKEERAKANLMVKHMLLAKAEILGTATKIEKILLNHKTALVNEGFELEYMEIMFSRIFAAFRLGNTRLIDNISLR